MINKSIIDYRSPIAGGAMDCPLCGAVEETVAHFITECAVLKDLGDALEEILLFREKTEEKVERSIGLLEEMRKKNKKRNGSTNPGTCTAVERAHRGADKKAGPGRTLSSMSK